MCACVRACVHACVRVCVCVCVCGRVYGSVMCGCKQKAAVKGIAQVCLSRITMAAPGMSEWIMPEVLLISVPQHFASVVLCSANTIHYGAT